MTNHGQMRAETASPQWASRAAELGECGGHVEAPADK